jgi:hypothetical protein
MDLAHGAVVPSGPTVCYKGTMDAQDSFHGLYSIWDLSGTIIRGTQIKIENHLASPFKGNDL